MTSRSIFLAFTLLAGFTGVAGAHPRAQGRSTTSSATIEGEVSGCRSFSRRFGPDFVLVLRPEKDAYGNCVGWNIEVRLAGDDVNLAGMNVPPHGPSVLDLYAWHFGEKTSDAAAYMSGGSVDRREFAFSPEVKAVYLRAAKSGKDARSRYEDIRSVEPFGQGDLRVLRFTVAPPKPHPIDPRDPATDPQADTLSFRVTMSWPSTYTGFSASGR